ncbi:gamma-glutamyltransferase 2 [Scopulibacillus darangshiensis]|uniref:Gamma-glutamyltransferase 2 n=1 Tax=Scopulibacillus darangshiensis TaxID=442528 RepID=A0A4R2P2T7_9BACL|nr:gamma-glutamyltransferase family protein [Scopulibacillus darangshiensis]TCP28887.1 gamma-glutamyltransferase 2 [Scopulibacillus darangshiensis]
MLQFDALYQPYTAKRRSTYARNGMVATSQPLAAQAGLDIMKTGGNAIDAAIATAACLTVVEPTSNGIGGDAFALIWAEGELHGLNASGPAPRNISIDQLKKAGYETMPKYGWPTVTVPGAPSGWAALSKRFGRLPLTEVLKPAIDYAEKGFPISPILGKYWKHEYNTFRTLKGSEFDSWFKTFAPHGRAPEVGEVWTSPDHAATLRSIAETNGESFYRGELADKIARFSQQYGGYLTGDDLASYQPEWVDPISVNYRGYDVWEIPPNGQGLVALQALNVLKDFDFPAKDAVETYHKQIEAIKLAFADGNKYITDLKYMSVKVDDLLSESYARHRRHLIGEKAMIPSAGKPPNGGTVYLATADGEGNMVSFIQSNYEGFGSGLVVPETGISLHNRGYDFSLDPSHDNALEPGKRPFHTIIPGFLTKEDEAIGPFSVMGGGMQPQGHLQLIMNTIDFHLNPQAALDAPRWRWMENKKVKVEHNFPHHLVEALINLGHDIEIGLDPARFGRGQIIWRDPASGVLVGGTEARTDGSVAAW